VAAQMANKVVYIVRVVDALTILVEHQVLLSVHINATPAVLEVYLIVGLGKLQK